MNEDYELDTQLAESWEGGGTCQKVAAWNGTSKMRLKLILQ